MTSFDHFYPKESFLKKYGSVTNKSTCAPNKINGLIQNSKKISGQKSRRKERKDGWTQIRFMVRRFGINIFCTRSLSKTCFDVTGTLYFSVDVSEKVCYSILAPWGTFWEFSEAIAQRCSVKKVFLESLKNPQESTCTRILFLVKLRAWACRFVKKQTCAQVFSCGFCEISKNTCFARTPPVVASEFWLRKVEIVSRLIFFNLISYLNQR